MVKARSALLAAALLIPACGDYGFTCALSGVSDCEAVAKVGVRFPQGTRDLLSVRRAECSDLNLPQVIFENPMQSCWIVVVTDPEVGTRDIAVFRDPEGILHAQQCQAPRC